MSYLRFESGAVPSLTFAILSSICSHAAHVECAGKRAHMCGSACAHVQERAKKLAEE